jgi:hypothetical protein
LVVVLAFLAARREADGLRVDDELLGLAILGSHGLKIVTFPHDLRTRKSLGQHFLSNLIFGDRPAALDESRS